MIGNLKLCCSLNQSKFERNTTKLIPHIFRQQTQYQPDNDILRVSPKRQTCDMQKYHNFCRSVNFTDMELSGGLMPIIAGRFFCFRCISVVLNFSAIPKAIL